MEDDRFGKTSERNSMNTNMKVSVNGMFQRKVSRVESHFTTGLLSKGTAGRDPPQEQVRKTTVLHKGQCAHHYQLLTFPDDSFCMWNYIHCNTF